MCPPSPLTPFHIPYEAKIPKHATFLAFQQVTPLNRCVVWPRRGTADGCMVKQRASHRFSNATEASSPFLTTTTQKNTGSPSHELCANVSEGVQGVCWRGGDASSWLGPRHPPAVHFCLHGEVAADDLHAAQLIADKRVRPWNGNNTRLLSLANWCHASLLLRLKWARENSILPTIPFLAPWNYETIGQFSIMTKPHRRFVPIRSSFHLKSALEFYLNTVKGHQDLLNKHTQPLPFLKSIQIDNALEFCMSERKKIKVNAINLVNEGINTKNNTSE